MNSRNNRLQFPCLKAGIASLILLTTLHASSASAQADHPADTTKAEAIEELLARAADLERQEKWKLVAQVYLQARKVAHEQRQKNPERQVVTKVSESLDWGIERAISERIRRLPTAGRQAYLLAVEPRAKALLQSIRQTDLDALSLVVQRFPFAPSAQIARRKLADLSLEFGDPRRAASLYIEFARAQETDAKARAETLNAASLCYQLVGNKAGIEFISKLAAQYKINLKTDTKLDPNAISSSSGKADSFVEPTWIEASGELAEPEVSDEVAKTLEVVPNYVVPVVDESGFEVYVADSKTIRSYKVARDLEVRWNYTVMRPNSEPERFEVGQWKPALTPELVISTINCNLPVKRTKKDQQTIQKERAEKKKKEEADKKRGKKVRVQSFDPDSEYTFKKRRNWRIVALERASGAVNWMAFDSSRLEKFSRDAEWISSPVVYKSAIYLSATLRSNALQAFLICLNMDGTVRYISKIASKTPENHRSVAIPLAPPTINSGKVYVATSLGIVACLEADSGRLDWAHYYPVFASGSQAHIVDEQKRFRLQSPILVDATSTVLVAPVDGPYMSAIDRDTGVLQWRAPRVNGDFVASVNQSHIISVGNRLNVLDGRSGLRVASHILDYGPACSSPIIAGNKIGVVSQSHIDWFELNGSELKPVKAFAFMEDVGYGHATTLSGGRLLVCNARGYTIFGGEERFKERYSEAGGYDKWQQTGIVYERQGQYDKAVGFYSQAVKTNQAKRNPQLRLESLKAIVRCLHEPMQFLDPESKRNELLDLGDQYTRLIQLALDTCYHPDVNDQEFAVQAIDYWLEMADCLAESDSKRSAKFAIETYQRILDAKPVVVERDNILIDAKILAVHKQKQLIDRFGREIYADIEAKASKLAQSAINLQTTSRMYRFIRQYPISEAANTLRLTVAESKQRRFLHQDAEQLYRDFLAHSDSTHPKRTVALIQLFDVLQKQNDTEAAGDVLRELQKQLKSSVESPDANAKRASGLVTQYASLLSQKKSRAVRRWESDTANLHGLLSVAYRMELDLDGAATLLPDPGYWYDLEQFVLWRHEKIEVRSADGGFLLWSAMDVPEPKEGRSIVGVGNTMIVPRSSQLTAHDGNTGKELWSYRVPDQKTPAILGADNIYRVINDNQNLYILDGWRVVHCVRGSDGKLLWKHKSAGQLTEKMAANAGVLALGLDNPAQVHLLDTKTGKISQIIHVTKQLNSVLSHQPKLHNGLLITVHGDRQVSAFDCKTGEKKFTKTFVDAPTISAITTDPAHKEIAVIGGQTPNLPNCLLVIDPVTGNTIWTDNGRGRAGAFGRPGSAALIENVHLGRKAVLSLRQRSRRFEVWNQDHKTGLLRWTWKMPLGMKPTRIIETPDAVILCYGSSLSLSKVDIIDRGTGNTRQSLKVPGRRVLGVHAKAGVLLVLTDRGQFAFTNIDHNQIKTDVVEIFSELQQRKNDKKLRALLADRLQKLGRTGPAIDNLVTALQSESLTVAEYELLFLKLNSLLEQQIEFKRPKHSLQRMTKPPEIDGILDDWWRNWTAIELKGPRHVSPILGDGGNVGVWQGNEDLSAKLYMGYDDRNLYFALDVRDMDLRPFDSEAETWIGDALMICIDCKNNGGMWASRDDMLLTLALTKPRKKKKNQTEAEKKQEQKRRPEGKYFVKRKENRSGIIYECKIPWAMFGDYGVQIDPNRGPRRGFTFGFNILLTDDDGHVNQKGRPRGAVKTLSWTPSLRLHHYRDRVWQGYLPEYFGKITLK